jgi:hypothetical protein
MKFSAVLLLFALASASPEVKYFRYRQPLQSSSGQSCLALGTEVFAHAAPQLADLRLYRDGAETPFVLRDFAPAESAQKLITPLNLGARNGQTVFDASLPDGPYSDLQLNVTGQNFIATVLVTGSQTESGSAETKIGSYTIFDLTSQKLGRSTVLHLPESDFRFLHFRIQGPLQPFTITGLSVERLPARQPRYLTVAASSRIARQGRALVVEFTLPAHLPVDRINFAPIASPALFSRAVSVTVAPASAADGGTQHQTVFAYGSLLRLHSIQNGRRIDEERLSLDAPVVDFSSPSKWAISIDNGDDAPLALQSVQLQMLERDLCFEAAANQSYTLYYGDEALSAPRYDYAVLFTPQPRPARVAAGPEALNPAFQPRPDLRPFTEKHPALLWVALVLVIVLLAAIALRTAKPTSQPR